jgi:hypothetical protein
MVRIGNNIQINVFRALRCFFNIASSLYWNHLAGGQELAWAYRDFEFGGQ